jgi:hypothetical protein
MMRFCAAKNFGWFLTAVAVLVSLYLCGVVTFAAATPWTGILAPARATDWSTAGVTGGIPNRTTVCVTLNPGATAEQITSALASCPSGQVVQLGAGLFTLASPIKMASNVTLRGQGMSTILTFTNCSGSGFQNSGSNVCISMQGPGLSLSGYGQNVGYAGVPTNTVRNWIGTNGQNGVYTQGATVLNLDSAPTGLTVGGKLTVWQSNAPDSAVPNPGYCCPWADVSHHSMVHGK